MLLLLARPPGAAASANSSTAACRRLSYRLLRTSHAAWALDTLQERKTGWQQRPKYTSCSKHMLRHNSTNSDSCATPIFPNITVPCTAVAAAACKAHPTLSVCVWSLSLSVFEGKLPQCPFTPQCGACAPAEWQQRQFLCGPLPKLAAALLGCLAYCSLDVRAVGAKQRCKARRQGAQPTLQRAGIIVGTLQGYADV
jgi:hypothetical protein